MFDEFELLLSRFQVRLSEPQLFFGCKRRLVGFEGLGRKPFQFRTLVRRRIAWGAHKRWQREL